MTQNQQVLVIAFALLLAQSGGASADAIGMNATAINQVISSGTPFTLTFATPISNATELLSISAGTATTDESGDFTLDVKYSGGSTQQIFDGTFPGGFDTIDLDTIADEAFTEGTVTGLVFETDSETGMQLIIPEDTDFTFATAPVVGAVPEPASVTLFGGALGFLAAAWRRRTRRGSTAV